MITELEDEIRLSWLRIEGNSTEKEQVEMSKAAYQVAKRYIEKALSDAFNQAHYSNLHPDLIKRMEYNEWAMKWLKENGVAH